MSRPSLALIIITFAFANLVASEAAARSLYWQESSIERLAYAPWLLEGTPRACSDRFQPPANPPVHVSEFNGIVLQDVCIHGPGPHHVFVIGDWGGIFEEPLKPPKPADMRSKHLAGKHRQFVVGADDVAQQKVAEQMMKRSLLSSPDYVLNMGDNFYWGGIDSHCGQWPGTVAEESGQWEWVFENVYTGEGLHGKQWLGILGNHDFGGYRFTHGWDQAIGYTWTSAASSTGRWLTPALYWAVTVRYDDFSIDYYFADSNVFDTFTPNSNQNHNICSRSHNAGDATCGADGPSSVEDCPRWFRSLWEAEVVWMQRALNTSVAEWQIVVTHFPPDHGQAQWVKLAADYGIDLIVTGHRHQQEVHYMEDENFLKPTAYIVSGGGGGITSESLPKANGEDDQYGFMDLTIGAQEIMIEAISHGGQLRSTTCVQRRIKGSSAQEPLTGPSMCEGRPSGPQPLETSTSSSTTTTSTVTSSTATSSTGTTTSSIDFGQYNIRDGLSGTLLGSSSNPGWQSGWPQAAPLAGAGQQQPAALAAGAGAGAAATAASDGAVNAALGAATTQTMAAVDPVIAQLERARVALSNRGSPQAQPPAVQAQSLITAAPPSPSGWRPAELQAASLEADTPVFDEVRAGGEPFDVHHLVGANQGWWTSVLLISAVSMVVLCVPLGLRRTWDGRSSYTALADEDMQPHAAWVGAE